MAPYLALASLTALALAPSAVSAQARGDLRARLEWSSSIPCVNEEEIERAVETQLERDALVHAGSSAELRLRGRLEAAGEGLYRLVLELTTDAGAPVGTSDRTIEEAECAELIDLVSVILSVMLNIGPEDLAEIAPPRSPWLARISASVAATIGILPRPGVETAISITAEARGSIVLGAELSFDWADEVRAGDGFMSVLAASARAIVGYTFLSDLVELTAHVGAGGGLMWASGRGFDRNTSGLAAIVDLRAGLRFGVQIAPPLWLFARAEIGFLPILPRFGVIEPDGATTVHHTPFPVFGVFGGGLALHLD
jgi:hypothetical protein